MSNENFVKIWETIKEQYPIDESFYPNRSLYHLQSGGISEVKELHNILLESNYKTSIDNIVSCMQLRKEIYSLFDKDEIYGDKIKLLSEGKVGAGFGAEEIISILIIYVLIRTGDSILTEFGKDVYDKIKNAFKKKIKNDEEKEILTQMTLELIEKKEIKVILSRIKKK